MIVFSSCKKEDNTIYQTRFWTTEDTASVKMDIYIDGTKRGVVHYLAEVPECCDDSIYKVFDPIPLNAGIYEFRAKDKQGNTRFVAKVEIKNSGSVSANYPNGKLDIYNSDDNLAFGISL